MSVRCVCSFFELRRTVYGKRVANFIERILNELQNNLEQIRNGFCEFLTGNTTVDAKFYIYKVIVAGLINGIRIANTEVTF